MYSACKPWALTVLCLMMLTSLSGCVVAIGNSSAPPPAPTDGEVVILRRPGQPDQLVYWHDRATISEIDATRQLSFENDRLEMLTRIAQRPMLSNSAQCRLVDAAFSLSFENNRLSLLQSLIANDAFGPPAKQRILDDIHRLSFESNRKAILQALLDRPPLQQRMLVIEPPAEYSPIPPGVQPPALPPAPPSNPAP